jgi:hypothetical protein
MTDSKKDLNTRVYNNADRNLDIELAAKRKLESKQPTDASSSGATISTDASSSGATISTKSGNKNALRHGGYFRGLLPWESREEFEALLKSFQEDWKPEGALQEQAVLSLSQWTWKRRRVLEGSEISYYRSPVAESLKSGEVSWDDMVQHQSKVPEETQALLASRIKLAEGLRLVCDRIGNHYYWTDTSEGKEIQSQLALMRSEIAKLASGVREHAFDENKNLQTAVGKITTLFDHAYQPDEIEKQINLLSMIDREIDKTIKRLIFLKTFKNVEADNEARKLGAHAQPLLDSPPVIPNEAPSVEVKTEESAPLSGTPTRPVALAAPEHRGKPKVD